MHDEKTKRSPVDSCRYDCGNNNGGQYRNCLASEIGHAVHSFEGFGNSGEVKS